MIAGRSWANGFAGRTDMPRRPNILFIMADDHAAKAIGAYGSRIVETPSIDRIAEGGKRLDHCYVTNSICTPSRASILPGTYNHVNEIGQASCRERGCKNVKISGVAGSIKKK